MNYRITKDHLEQLLYENVPAGTFFEVGNIVYLKILGNYNFNTSYKKMELGNLLHVTVCQEPGLGTMPAGTVVTILPKGSVTITN